MNSSTKKSITFETPEIGCKLNISGIDGEIPPPLTFPPPLHKRQKNFFAARALVFLVQIFFFLRLEVKIFLFLSLHAHSNLKTICYEVMLFGTSTLNSSQKPFRTKNCWFFENEEECSCFLTTQTKFMTLFLLSKPPSQLKKTCVTRKFVKNQEWYPPFAKEGLVKGGGSRHQMY